MAPSWLLLAICLVAVCGMPPKRPGKDGYGPKDGQGTGKPPRDMGAAGKACKGLTAGSGCFVSRKQNGATVVVPGTCQQVTVPLLKGVATVPERLGAGQCMCQLQRGWQKV